MVGDLRIGHALPLYKLICRRGFPVSMRLTVAVPLWQCGGMVLCDCAKVGKLACANVVECLCATPPDDTGDVEMRGCAYVGMWAC